MSQNYSRTGETTKCPACGVGVDAGAYRCPRCFIYFCYKCRIQLAKIDPQFRCRNQQCDCHGKLLCASCSPNRIGEPPKVNVGVEFTVLQVPLVEPARLGWWPLLLFVIGLVAIGWYYWTDICVRIGISIAGFFIFGFLWGFVPNGTRLKVEQYGAIRPYDVDLLQRGICVLTESGEVKKAVEDVLPQPRVCIACQSPVEVLKVS